MIHSNKLQKCSDAVIRQSAKPWNDAESYFYHEYAYALRGEKVVERIAGKKFQRTNIVDAKLDDKILAPMQYNGTTDAPLFEFWFERWCRTFLKILDNASFRSKKYLEWIVEKYHRRILLLPPYSSELNPIENFWHILEYWLRMHIRDWIPWMMRFLLLFKSFKLFYPSNRITISRKNKNRNPLARFTVFSVPLTGLEPVRILLRGILSPSCLPIPPQRQQVYYTTK